MTDAERMARVLHPPCIQCRGKPVSGRGYMKFCTAFCAAEFAAQYVRPLIWCEDHGMWCWVEDCCHIQKRYNKHGEVATNP